MSRSLILLVVILAPVVLGCAWYVTAVERAPVTRTRLNAFARRQALTVTATNGNEVIRYLAITRRWRATGLVAGLLASVGWALTRGHVAIDFLSLFAGWFVGALVAEFRLAREQEPGPRRTASLSPRNPTSYLPREAWLLLAGATAISLVVGGASLATVLSGHGIGVAGALWCAGAIVVASVVLLVQRRVLNRPQRLDAPDVVAADDAIRSRSLHVLAGGGTSLVLYCVLGQVAMLAPAVSGALAEALGAALFFGVIVIPLLGWAIATTPWPVSRLTGRTTDGLAGDGAR